MTTRRDYMAEAVDAARSVLLELTRMLGAYRDHLVVVGGWVPELLLHEAEPRHVGSLDIDIAVDHRSLPAVGYKTIHQLLVECGYAPDEFQAFVYLRRVRVGGREIVVHVDLLAGEYQGTDRSDREQPVQDVRPRKVRGCDLALDMATEIEVRGTLPNGASDSATVRVAAIVPFIAMKGMAMFDRLKEKDAYDIYYCVRSYPGGIDALAAAFAPHVGHGLVAEGLRKIAGKFASPGAFGPTAIADFEQLDATEDRARVQRDAYERVAALLARLGITRDAP